MDNVFVGFLLFGLLNNVLYVIILSAAIDLVGEATPKAVVLLPDIIPAFTIKLVAPLFIHLIPYNVRLMATVALSFVGMLCISVVPSLFGRIFGIVLASFSSGVGEITFLQLSHYYHRKPSLGGFASGTGCAGLFGSFYYMVLTNLFKFQSWKVLLLSSFLPFGFLVTFYWILPPFQNHYVPLDTSESPVLAKSSWKHSFTTTIAKIKPLVIPYMVPLCLVYICEYTINQGISPTLLYPLDKVPRWLFLSYRDMYVVYGFQYQLGVFISRSSINFGVRIHNLYMLSALQFVNVVILLFQSLYDIPFTSIYVLMVVMFYEGLLGGFSYINTFMSVSEEVEEQNREFCMGSVTISDSLGIVIAGLISWLLEPGLCRYQVDHGRNWCLGG